jgi:hypothetical protein
MSDDDKALRLKTLVREIRDELGEHDVLDALSRALAAERLAVAELTEEIAGLKRDLEAVRLVQKSRDILLPQARAQYAGRRKVVVEAGGPMPADHGFYGLERDGLGNPFRWTGPTQAFHFDFHLDRSVPLRFSLRMPMWGSEHAQGLRAMSDDVTLVLTRRPGNRVLDFEGLLMPREQLGATRLTFIAERTSPASSEADEGVTRHLGVPFLRLTVGEANEVEVAESLGSAEPPAAESPTPDQASIAVAAEDGADSAET